jgi:hypothetical protein
MASVYNLIITDNSLYEFTFKLDFQCLKPLAPLNVIIFDYAVRFNLFTVN